MKKRQFRPSWQSNGPKSIKEPAGNGERPAVTVEPTSDEEVALRLKHEADAIRRLTRELLPLAEDIANQADLPESRVRELAGDLLAAGPSDPLLALALTGIPRRINGAWVTVYHTVLTQQEAPAAVDSGVWLDDRGEPDDEDIAVDLIAPAFRARAIGDLQRGELWKFFRTPLMHGASQIDLLIKSAGFLRDLGWWEKALVVAYRAERDRRPLSSLQWLLESTDRERLRAAADPLPGPGPFTIYRGVGNRRRITGPSWTSSLETAVLGAAVSPVRLRDPAVYVTTVTAEDVYFYIGRARVWPERPDILGDDFVAIVAPGAVERLNTDEVRTLLREFRRPPATDDEIDAMTAALLGALS